MTKPLNAFCPGPAIRRAGAEDGLLAGLTFAVKDVFDLAGLTTGAGSPDWADTHGPATEDAEAVRRLLGAGATLIGRTICDELASSMTGENSHYGTPVNPRAPGRVPGGSSSGSASAVAGRLCDFALGTDTTGSIRVPASYCGLYGMRPSHGAVSSLGVVPLAPSFDTVGWLARVGDVLLPTSNLIPVRKILMAADAFDVADKEAARCLERSLDAIQMPVPVERGMVAAPDGLRQWVATFVVLRGWEAWATHGAWITATDPALDPAIRSRFDYSATIASDSYATALLHMKATAEGLTALVAPGTVLCCPTAPGIAMLRNSPPGLIEDVRNRTLALTALACLGRLPQVTIPAAELEGCPLGLSFIGARGEDRGLLAFVAEIAGALGIPP